MQVLCGYCGMANEVDESLKGSTITCTCCRREITVPNLDQEPEAPAEQSEGGFADVAIQAMQEKIRVICASCKRGLKVPVRMAGRKATCPGCGERIRIPHPHEDEDFEIAQITERNRDESDDAGLIELIDDFKAVAAADKPKSPRREIKQYGMFWSLLIVGCIIVAVGLFALSALMNRKDSSSTATSPKQDTPKVDNAVKPPTSQTQTDKTGQTETSASLTSSTQENKEDGSVVVVVDDSQPPPEPATCRMVSSKADMFISDGYLPAQPGRLYWKVAVEIKAGTSPLVLKPYDGSVKLVVGDLAYLALGLAGDGSAMPAKAVQKEIRLEPKNSGTFTFIFDVPQTIESGSVVVGDIGTIATGKMQPLAGMGDKLPVGEFVEVQPRNLKPLLRDPVMAAIQSADTNRMVISQRRDGVDVSFPDAGVNGQARSLGGGLYAVELATDEAKLSAKLRLVPGGDTMILYLKDQPFHQITFKRK